MIIHRIAAGDCLSRQSCNYHKCHRCIYRGKAAGWEPTGSAANTGRTEQTGERAVPTRLVEVPRPDAGGKKTGKRKAAPKQPSPL